MLVDTLGLMEVDMTGVLLVVSSWIVSIDDMMNVRVVYKVRREKKKEKESKEGIRRWMKDCSDY